MFIRRNTRKPIYTWYYCSEKLHSVILKDKMSIIHTRGSAGDL